MAMPPTTEAVGLPAPQQPAASNGVDPAEADRVAKRVADEHRNGLRARRYRDLTSEKYLLHIDGEGDAQWADIFQGERIEIPRSLSSSIRVQENLLRIIVANAVAYDTTMPLRFFADSKGDRASKERAKIDGLVVNHVAEQQRLNSIAAEAMYMAMPAGNCPIHTFWRDDINSDPYEPVWNPGMQGMQKGLIDIFCGDPFDTVYNSGAKRNSVNWSSYGRTLPAQLIRDRYGIDINGSTRLTSASRFQRTVRRWVRDGLSTHGSAAMSSGTNNEELVAIICREWAPGVDARYPNGRLVVVALDGAATTDPIDGTAGRPVMLHDGPLPAGKFSAVRVYSDYRFDDVLGKPFVGDIDDLQVVLNQYLSLRAERIRRSTRSPLVTYGDVEMDSAVWDDDAHIEVNDPKGTAPFFLGLPNNDPQTLDRAITETRDAMFRLGGYNAASRGESSAGDAAAKVVALQSADDTIHGPRNQRFRESMEAVAGNIWSNFKTYADVPWFIDVAGDDYADVAESYIDKSKLSEREPNFRVVSGFGSTPETRGQNLMNLVMAKGADGMPLLSTSEFKKLWPDDSLYTDETNVREVKEKRARVINARIRKLANEQGDAFKQAQASAQQQVATLPPEWQQSASQNMQMQAQQAVQQLAAQLPAVLPDDDAQVHYDTLSEITQDESENPLARQIATVRQQTYRTWLQQQQMAAQGAAPAPTGQSAMQHGGAPVIAGKQQGSGQMENIESKVHQLTAQANDARANQQAMGA